MRRVFLIKKTTSAYFVYENEGVLYVYKKRRFRSGAFLYSATGELKARVTSKIWHLFNELVYMYDTNESLTIQWKSIIYKPWVCFEYNSHKYDIVFHKSNRFSIFKNENQIGYGERSQMYFFTNEKINLIINENEVNVFMLAFILSSICSFSEDEIININVSYAFSERKKFDENWLQ